MSQYFLNAFDFCFNSRTVFSLESSAVSFASLKLSIVFCTIFVTFQRYHFDYLDLACTFLLILYIHTILNYLSSLKFIHKKENTIFSFSLTVINNRLFARLVLHLLSFIATSFLIVFQYDSVQSLLNSFSDYPLLSPP